VRFGVHVSIGGGLRKAVESAQKLKCETIQIFSRNPRGWKFGALDPEAAAGFRQAIRDSGICPVAVHMPYLPNLTSANPALYRRSVASLAVELERAAELGAHFVVLHLGRRLVESRTRITAAGRRMIAGINRALRTSPPPVLLLLENTAQPEETGARFLGLKAMFDGVASPNRLGVVLDTAHAFESGCDLHTRDGLNAMLRELDATVGLKRLHLLHLNDSKTELGSGADRHWHIGQGHIGRAGFAAIVNHPLLRHLPGILETPKKVPADDRRNLRVIRSLVQMSVAVSRLTTKTPGHQETRQKIHHRGHKDRNGKSSATH
jgi:deoxyribonuclease-4